MVMTAVTVDVPLGRAIAQGRRSAVAMDWRPPSLPIADLLIVEAARDSAANEEPQGRAVAVVTLAEVDDWSPPDQGACSAWPPGWLAWTFTNVRPIAQPFPVRARSGLYTVILPDDASF